MLFRMVARYNGKLLAKSKKQQLAVAEDRKHRDLIKSLVNETFLFETIVVDTTNTSEQSTLFRIDN